MNKIQIFNHEQFGDIRIMTDEKGETFFVGNDVAKALGYSDARKAIRVHVDSDDRGVDEMATPGGIQKVVIINESGLYALVLSSKLPQAKAFKRWVTSEVLPQIRRTGGYIPTRNPRTGEELTAEEVVRKAEEIVGRTLRLLNAPNADCMTATAVARNWGMDVKSFNQMLCKMGVQKRRGGRYYLSEELEGLGLAEDRVFFSYSLKGEPKMKTYLTWTARGVEFLNQEVEKKSLPHKPYAVQLSLVFNA